VLPALVQSTTGSGSGTSLVVAFTGNNAGGNHLVAILAALTNDPTGATDTGGNSYSAGPTAVNTSSAMKCEMYYAENCAAGANTVTGAFTGSDSVGMTLMEFSNVLQSGSLNQQTSTGGTATGTAMTAGTITTTQAGELIVYAGTIRGGTTIAPGAGFTEVSDFSYARQFEVSYQVASPAGSYTGTATAGTGDDYCAIVASFFPIPPPPLRVGTPAVASRSRSVFPPGSGIGA